MSLTDSATPPQAASRRLIAAAVSLALGTVGASASARAEEEARQLPKIEVEGEAPSPYQVDRPSSPKYRTPLLETPQTITVIPRTLIEEQGATTLRDVLRNTPGITFQAGEGGTPAGDQMTIRGFSARTDIFIDGVRDLGGYTRDSFNLEQVEVTKGPSSTVAGRGATGAAINMVTKTPQSEAFRRFSAGAGNEDYRRATVDANQPLTDSTALRLNAMWQDAGVPGRDEVENSSWGIAPTLAFGLDTPTRVMLSYLHLDQDNVPDYGLPWDALDAEPAVDQSNFYGLTGRDYELIDNDVATVRLEHDFSERHSVSQLVRYGRTRRDSVITAPRFEAGSTDIIRRTDWKSRDQVDDVFASLTNFALSFTAGGVRHELSTGFELLRETEKNFTRVEDPATVLPTTGLYDPNPDDLYTGSITRNGAFTEGTADSAALYLFDTVHLSERWQLNGGARWDRFDAEQTVVDAAGVATTHDRIDRELSWQLGAVYKPVPHGSVYLGIGTSFNPSAEGLSLTTRGRSLADVPPEETRSYELGTKWNLMQERLAVTAAVFRTQKTNARTPGLDPNDPPQVLDGEQHVDGIELSFAGSLSEYWHAFAGYAFMDSEIEASNTADEVGNSLGLTPEHTFNLWTTYVLPRGLTVGGGAQYMDQVFRRNANDISVPSYWLVNVMAQYAITSNVGLRLNALNLTDEEYVDRVGGGHYIPGPGRSVWLTADIRF